MSLTNLLSPIQVGRYTLKNRMIMAPLTRIRADEQHVPTPMMIKHFADRATAGLLIADATIVNPHSGFYTEPGIYNEAQIAAWREVVNAVHAKGGLIFCQIVHAGRAAHSANSGLQPEAPSAIGVEGHKIPAWFLKSNEASPYEVPRALEDSELPAIQEQFVQAAKNAIEAGFDGVEIHSANGYLLDEFLKDSSNKRDAPYGGSLENRCRFVLEVVDKVAAAIGSDRVGIRLSPINSYNGQSDANPEGLVTYLGEQLSEKNIAYVHMMRADFFQAQKGDPLAWTRKAYKGTIIANMGYGLEDGEAEIESGRADAIAFGTKFLANPDLVYRAEKGLELNTPNQATFYGHTEEGYNDYPFAS